MKLLIASVSVVLSLGIGAAQEATTVKRVPVHPTTSVAGKDVFHAYCAVCHGATAKGDGPAAPALKIPPPDLTRIAQKNGGKFPELRVQDIITGRTEGPAAHGSSEMPVWGPLFKHMELNPDMGTIRVFNLLKYIESIQVK